jgi:hypothetical protein
LTVDIEENVNVEVFLSTWAKIRGKNNGAKTLGQK